MFLISFPLSGAFPTHPMIENKNKSVLSSSQSVDYVLHPIIMAIGNSELLSLGFEGNGTSDNPIVIENLLIESDYYCIRIFNTTLHLIIRNCLIRGETFAGRYGIYISGCSNVTIEDNHILLKGNGVYFYNSIDSFLRGNIIRYCSEGGSLFYNCFNISMSGNSIGGCDDYGHKVSNSDFILIDNNAFEANLVVGLAVSVSANCTIIDNHLNGNECGIEITRSDDCIITSNTMIGNGLVIVGDEDSGWRHEVTENTVNDLPIGFFSNLTDVEILCMGYGQIILLNSQNVVLKQGSFSNSSIGVQIGFSFNCTVEQMMFHNNLRSGIQFRYVAFSEISDCYFLRNEIGITFGHCISNTIHKNFITMCDESGIQLVEASDCVIENNLLLRNRNGIQGFFSQDSVISKNTINMCNITGIYGERNVRYSILNNNIENSGGDGIALYECTDGLVQANNISFSSQNGIFVYGTLRSEILDNRIWNNGDSGVNSLLSYGCNVRTNIVYHNRNGVRFSRVEESIVIDNILILNEQRGISFYRVTLSYILQNLIANNTIGIHMDSSCSGNIFYSNSIGYNSEHNARDNGYNNTWDDGFGQGNSWSDYENTDDYLIYGSADGIDHFPSLMDLDITHIETGDSDPDLDSDPDTLSIVPIILLSGFLVAISIILWKRRSVSSQ